MNIKELKIKNYTTLDFYNILPKLKDDLNKYSRGKCTCIAGGKSYPGAAILSSNSADISGCGYVELYTYNKYVDNIAINYPSIPVWPYENISECLDKSSNYKNPKSFVVGPGFNRDDKFLVEIIFKIVENVKNTAIVFDAGALNFICDNTIKNAIKKNKNKNIYILTPHMGEAFNMASNLNIEVNNSKDNFQLYLCKKLSEIFNAICILKDSDTYIYNKNQAYIYTLGGPELSHAGSGDILAGILGSLYARGGKEYFDYASLGVYIHGLAAHLASIDNSVYCVDPSSLLNYIPKAFKYILDSSKSKNNL